jgi:hypothetical protein
MRLIIGASVELAESDLQPQPRLLTVLDRMNAELVIGRVYPISSAIAESAVNQAVSARMAKGQPMRWCEEGARPLERYRGK